MKLSEIRELLAFKDNPKTDCGWINSMIEGHIASVTEQIASLTHLKGHLEGLLGKCSGNHKHGCGILESLSEAKTCPYCEDSRCCVEHMQNPANPA